MAATLYSPDLQGIIEMVASTSNIAAVSTYRLAGMSILGEIENFCRP